MVLIDSSRARSMKAHVLTITHSASSARSVIGWPAAARRPSMSSESTWFFGQPSVVRWTFTSRSAVAVVVELERDPEILVPQQGDDLLQIIARLAGDADLVLVDRGLDLQLRVLDQAHDLLGLLDGDPLLEGDLLPQLVARRLLDGPVGEPLQRDAALVQLRLQDVRHRLQLHLVGGEQRDVGLLELHLVLGALEIVARLDLPPRLVERVGDLLHVDLADDIERVLGGHEGYRLPPLGSAATGAGASGGGRWRSLSAR